jgi:hypothetical protein
VPSAPAPAHPLVAPLLGLVGTWRGEGQGGYPTIEPFAYGEEVRWTHNGKPFLAYTQRTWALDDERPLHAEAGYLRPQPDGTIELVMAMPTGHVEVAVGTWDGRTIDLASTSITATPGAKDVAATRRIISFDGDVLRYVVDLAAVGRPLQRHLDAVLHRVPDGPPPAPTA